VYWLGANLILGLFNMLPFGPLDGLKVKDWSDGAFFTVIGVFALLVFTMFTGVWSPTVVLETIAEPVSNLIR
jgi:Zn-dependent protease